jgi:hypothetical protein
MADYLANNISSPVFARHDSVEAISPPPVFASPEILRYASEQALQSRLPPVIARPDLSG